jgi:hypothetical protein
MRSGSEILDDARVTKARVRRDESGEARYRPFRNQQVGGSIPLAGTKENKKLNSYLSYIQANLTYGVPLGVPVERWLEVLRGSQLPSCLRSRRASNG